MKRPVVIAAIGVIVVAGLIAYFATRTSDQPDPNKSVIGGGPELTIDSVQFEGAGGRGKRKTTEHGFALPAGVTKKGKVVLTGKNATGAESLLAQLVAFDVTERVGTPLCELPVTNTPPNGFKIEVPTDKLRANGVYRILLSTPDSAHKAVYQFNVAMR